MTNATTNQVSHELDEATRRRAAFIQSLRDAADFLEQHPGVQAPRYINLSVFVNTRDELAAQARAATWEKAYNYGWFYLRREFGEDLSIEIAAPRDMVCRKVVVGTQTVPAQPEREVEVVEWVCDDAAVLR